MNGGNVMNEQKSFIVPDMHTTTILPLVNLLSNKNHGLDFVNLPELKHEKIWYFVEEILILPYKMCKFLTSVERHALEDMVLSLISPDM